MFAFRGAKIAGPAISLSFLSCGLACILTSFSYAEFASRIPVAGSAFTYAYVAFGEFYAWIVGWNLVLGYGFTASVTARAWGDYTCNLLLHVTNYQYLWMKYLTEFPLLGSSIHYTCSPLSTIIIGLGTYVLSRGAKDSSIFSNIVTILNLAVLGLVICAGIGSTSINTDNLVPFAPHGLPSILQGAGLVFFAFIGFDMVASLSEEVVHPERNMPIGIVGSLITTTCIYVAVSIAVVGMAPVTILGETVPVVNALIANACCTHEEQLLETATYDCLSQCTIYEKPWLGFISRIVGGGAIFGLKASCFTSLMGQPRIFYRMAQDGLWFSIFAQVDPITQVPLHGIYITGIATSILACFVPLEALANLISLGTLMVFTFVSAGVILLRMQTISELTIQRLQTEDGSGGHSSSNLLLVERKKVMDHTNNVIVYSLLIYSGSVLVASLLVSNTTSASILVGCCILTALVSGLCILYLPETWDEDEATTIHYSNTTTATPSRTTNHDHVVQFKCPWVPVLPLGGVACNIFMMGSLPLSSWILCFLWLICGIALYLTFGIHHSTLNKKSRYMSSDAIPLLPGSTIKQDGYDSTLNVSIHEVHHIQ